VVSSSLRIAAGPTGWPERVSCLEQRFVLTAANARGFVFYSARAASLSYAQQALFSVRFDALRRRVSLVIVDVGHVPDSADVDLACVEGWVEQAGPGAY
jgi:hypothetical protein